MKEQPAWRQILKSCLHFEKSKLLLLLLEACVQNWLRKASQMMNIHLPPAILPELVAAAISRLESRYFHLFWKRSKGGEELYCFRLLRGVVLAQVNKMLPWIDLRFAGPLLEGSLSKYKKESLKKRIEAILPR